MRSCFSWHGPPAYEEYVDDASPPKYTLRPDDYVTQPHIDHLPAPPPPPAPTEIKDTFVERDIDLNSNPSKKVCRY